MRSSRSVQAFACLALAGFLLPTFACFGQAPLRPSDLLAAPATYLNRQVELEIVEPLYGPTTPAALAANEYVKYQIQIPEAMAGAELSLVTSAFQLNDPKRYRHKFDKVVTSPLKVRGELLNDEDLGKQTRRPAYVLRVASWEPLPLSSPESVSLATLQANPGRYDRTLIVYEGTWQHGFENSSLDKEIWITTRHDATIIGRPLPARSHQVRVTGILFAKPGARYGHLGGYKFEMVASKVEYLSPISP